MKSDKCFLRLESSLFCRLVGWNVWNQQMQAVCIFKNFTKSSDNKLTHSKHRTITDAEGLCSEVATWSDNYTSWCWTELDD